MENNIDQQIGIKVTWDGLDFQIGEEKHPEIPEELRSAITEAVITDEAEYIPSGAFLECENLREVTIPDTVQEIEENAFSGCKSLKNVSIPNSVIVIGKDAFAHCESLEKIHIPKSVEQIAEGNIFFECYSLREITTSPDNKEYWSKNNCLITKSGELLSACQNSEIPCDKSIDTIGEFAFSGLNISQISIPENIKHIKEAAFAGCEELKNIDISNGLQSIGRWAFEFCDSLLEIEIPESVKKIDTEAFNECESLSRVVLPASLARTGINSEYFCADSRIECTYKDGRIDQPIKLGLEKVTILPGTTEIREHAFEDCERLSDITIPSSVKKIGAQAFSNCISLQSITIPESVERIGDYCFGGCECLKEVIFKSDKVSLGEDIFTECDANNLKIYVEDSDGTRTDMSDILDRIANLGFSDLEYDEFRGREDSLPIEAYDMFMQENDLPIGAYDMFMQENDL